MDVSQNDGVVHTGNFFTAENGGHFHKPFLDVIHQISFAQHFIRDTCIYLIFRVPFR